MSLIDLLSWDAFGSGWFWSLVVLQWFWHGAQVLGVPADCLHCKDNAQLSMVINWRAKRRLRSAHRAPLVFVAGLSFLVSVLFILGFVYHIEFCAAAAILIVPEVIIFQLRHMARRFERGRRTHERTFSEKERKTARKAGHQGGQASHVNPDLASDPGKSGSWFHLSRRGPPKQDCNEK